MISTRLLKCPWPLHPCDSLFLPCSLRSARWPPYRDRTSATDAMRDNWMTLNGEWQFEIDRKGDGEARGLVSGKALASKIVVPFCPESNSPAWALATANTSRAFWYRRLVDLPRQ